MSAGDPRLTLVRDGLADLRLQGLIPAERFARTCACTIISPSAPLTGASDPAAERASELLFGEGFDVLSEDGEYAFGQTARDGYVGFVQKAALRQGAPSPRWRVSALRTYAFAEPSIKSAAIGPFSRNALIEADRSEGRFVHALGAGWFVREHLAPIGRFDADPARLALDYLGTPYLWRGSSRRRGLIPWPGGACPSSRPSVRQFLTEPDRHYILLFSFAFSAKPDWLRHPSGPLFPDKL